MIFTSNNIIKPLPILSNGSKNNNDDYLIINEEMKINKNIFENNLFNLIHSELNKKKLRENYKLQIDNKKIDLNSQINWNKMGYYNNYAKKDDEWLDDHMA